MTKQDMNRDITSSEDLTILVRAFYEKVLTDEIIGFFFTHIAKVDLEEHTPKIVSFWEMQLFGRRSFRGNTYLAHKKISNQAFMSEHHFHRWIYLFHSAVDSLFKGPNADRVKINSLAIAKKMQLSISNGHQFAPTENNEPSGLKAPKNNS